MKKILFYVFMVVLIGFNQMSYAESSNKTSQTMPEELKSAIRKGDIEYVKTYLKGGGNVNAFDQAGKRGQPALFYSLSMEKTEIAKLLIENGADLTIKSGADNRFLITEAAGQGYLDIVEMISNKVKDVSQLNEALLSSAVNSRVEVVELLLKKGANPNAKDKRGNPVVSIIGKNRKLLEMLINAGADVNVKDQNEQTILMHAAYKGDIELVKFLLSKGANVSIKGLRGKTALDLAAQMDNAEVVKVLQGAAPDKR